MHTLGDLRIASIVSGHVRYSPAKRSCIGHADHFALSGISCANGLHNTPIELFLRYLFPPSL